MAHGKWYLVNGKWNMIELPDFTSKCTKIQQNTLHVQKKREKRETVPIKKLIFAP